MRGSGILLVTIAIAFFTVGCVPVAEVEAMKQQWIAEKASYESNLAKLRRNNARFHDENQRLTGKYDRLRSEHDEYAQELDKYRQRTKGHNIDWIRDGNTIIVRLPNKILFDSGKTFLKPGYLGTLNTVGEILRDDFADGIIRVEGHTDNVPIVRNKDKFPTNWELSCHRACEVTKYLIKQGFKSQKQVYAAGYGEYRPIASNATRTGKAKNRRVEIVILPPKSMASNDTTPEPMQLAMPASEIGPEDVVPEARIPLK